VQASFLVDYFDDVVELREPSVPVSEMFLSSMAFSFLAYMMIFLMLSSRFLYLRLEASSSRLTVLFQRAPFSISAFFLGVALSIFIKIF
ncbi:MAG: hypothetical protein KKI16_05470, partial [Alphaproteobacteria bacterium]|nr:hypothetical protein [Alphaproteobacteria bacterium]